ncbi:Mitochondrial transcription termination factor, mTERF [Plasmopara halstedii]|uniref:Mitochondrial transcription termination factor, mTERF n=1 Tax=Plasmopara halstedii TaxID=4781 RepID=A0A0P1A9Y7_PLAHL|nr:Mitochondrial transcription termination factor, mTERF [Plasmopara halstedii]CEG37553.1 Mitochondrial transcription termination factor, mTERF [Plasmopara halstedii]|eukprot:XP_024573922.1 Mitochondrial transcription termination factor, mTERF [Plasmopara halstedii]
MLRLLRFYQPLLALKRSSSSTSKRPLEDAVAIRRQESAYYARFSRKYPSQIGPLSMEAVDRTTRYLTIRGLSHTQALRAISHHVMITRYSPEMMERKINWLSNLGLSQDNINTIIVRQPSILGSALEKHENLVRWYTDHGVPKHKMVYVFKVFPGGVAFSLEKLNTKVEFFKGLGCENDQIARILRMAPQVLAYSVEKMQAAVHYLEKLGVPSEQVPAITTRVPQYLGLKTTRIKETVDTLDDMFGPMAGVQALISNSRIVMHKVSSLRRSYNFLLSVGYTKERLVQCMRFVTRSESRILRPRVQFLKAQGVDVVENVSWILMPENQFKIKYSGYSSFFARYITRPKKRRM